MKDGREFPFLLLVRQRLHSKHATHAQAMTAARELIDREREFGREVRAFDVREWRRYLEAKAKYFGGREPDWAVIGARQTPEHSPLVQTAVADFLRKQEQRAAQKRISAGTYRQKKSKLTKFAASFRGRHLAEITQAQIEAWLASLPDVKAADSLNDHVKKVHELFEEHRNSVPDNPASGIELRRALDRRDRIAPVAEVAKFLSYAKTHKPWLLPRLATEIFLGARHATAARLSRDGIMPEAKAVRIHPDEIKTGETYLIQSVPENYWKWVVPWLDDARCWSCSPSQYMHAKKLIKEGSEALIPHNAFRHSAATYHVNAFRSPGDTALMLCHRDQQMLWQRYFGKASKADAEAFYALVP